MIYNPSDLTAKAPAVMRRSRNVNLIRNNCRTRCRFTHPDTHRGTGAVTKDEVTFFWNQVNLYLTLTESNASVTFDEDTFFFTLGCKNNTVFV